MVASRFPIIRGLDPLVSRLQDNVSALVGPVAEALQSTPIMGAAPPPWTLAQLLNGYVSASAFIPGFFPPAWQLDALGYVHLRGGVAHVAGTAAFTTLFILPLAMRPAGIHTNSPDAVSQGLAVYDDGRVQNVAVGVPGGFVSVEFIFQAGG